MIISASSFPQCENMISRRAAKDAEKEKVIAQFSNMLQADLVYR